jgi:hypothetical protein
MHAWGLVVEEEEEEEKKPPSGRYGGIRISRPWTLGYRKGSKAAAECSSHASCQGGLDDSQEEQK